MNRKFRVKIK